MLTGRLPFEGDSAVSVAIQHISSIPLMPREINPEVPVGLETITMKAMNPDLAARYQSADEIYDDLEAFRKDPETDFDYSEKDLPGALAPPEPYEPELPERRVKPVRPVSRRGEMSREDYIRSRQRARRVSTLSGIFLAMAAILALFYFLWTYWLRDIFTTPETMQVPVLTGSRLDDVMLNRGFTDYFNIIPEYEYNDDVAEGTIFGQSPAPGRTVIRGDKKADLMVTVSNGGTSLLMPAMVNT
jgi:serine/threonine-protein kinase